MINKFKEWSKNHKYEQATDNAFLDSNFQAWQAGYELAKEELDSSLTCDHCCNELGVDDGSVRLCRVCNIGTIYNHTKLEAIDSKRTDAEVNLSRQFKETFEAGYELAKEEQDSNLTCDQCCNELGMDDGSIRLCGECKGKEKHFDTVIYSGEDLPPPRTPVLALISGYENQVLVGYCDEEQKWYFHYENEYLEFGENVQSWCYLPDFSKKETAKNDETLTCNHCNISVDYHPWHHSIGDNPHVHLCNECHEKHINLWIIVRDKQPELNKEVIMCRNGVISAGAFYTKNEDAGGFVWLFQSGLKTAVDVNDYWQSLPEPPNEEDN